MTFFLNTRLAILLSAFAIVFLFMPKISFAAITVLATSTNVCNNCSSTSFSHTVSSANNRILIVAFENSDNPGSAAVTGVTYGGIPLTLASSAHQGAGLDAVLYYYYLVNPPVGTANVSISLANPITSFISSATSLAGVNTLSPIRSATSSNTGVLGTSATLFTSSASGDLVLDTVCEGAASIQNPGASQTKMFVINNTAGTPCDALAQSTASGASQVNTAWTFGASDVYIESALSIRPASGGLSKPANKLGLVAYWSFDEGQGGLIGDYSGNGNFGTTTGNPTWTSGKLGKALQFSTGHEGMQVQGTLGSPQKATLMAWVNIRGRDLNGSNVVSLGDGVFLVADASNDGGSTYLGVEGGFNGGGAPCPVFGSYCTTDTNINISGTGWHHIAYATDPANSRQDVYIDGVLKASTSYNTTITFPNTMTRIGRDSGYGDFGNVFGKIDEIRVYNRALSTNEIASIYRSGAAKLAASSADLDAGSSVGSGLVAHWTMDGADTQQNVTDRSVTAVNTGYLFGQSTSSFKTIGKLGQALKSNGTSGYVNINNVLDDIATGNLSVGFWFKPSVNMDNTTPESTFFDIGDNVGSDNDILFGIGINAVSQPDGSVWAAESTGAGINSVGSTQLSWSANTWYHAVYTYNTSSGSKLYINGVQVGQNSGTARGSNAATLGALFRNAANANNYFNGAMDDVRVYNKTLSAAEVKQLYQLGTMKVKP